MNILVIGNGFDLAHGLPTKYVDFLEIKCIPDIEDYEYVPVNNSMLAKAEIPFLIFERNRGKCFIEMY